MNTGRVILATLVIFIAGIITGVLVVTATSKLTQRTITRPANNNTNAPANPWQVRSRDLLRRMDRELDLSTDQHKRIETLIGISQERTKELWRPITPQMNKELQLLRAEIRDQLSADQKTRFDVLLKTRPAAEKRKGATNTVAGSATNPVAVPMEPTNSVTN